MVRCLLGLVLLLAALLKFYGLAIEPVARMGLFSTPEFQVAVIEFEVFLAVWLLSGWRPLGSWLLALATFTGFAVVSFWQGWIGQASCGCFGRLAVSPWYAFTLDVTLLALLLIGRPDLKPLRSDARRSFARALLPAAGGLGALALVTGLLLGGAHVAFGSMPAALAYFRGERVSVTPRLVDVGAGVGGETRRVSVTVTNWTDGPVQLFGGTADCSCTVLHDLPVTVPARESRSVAVEMRLPGTPGLFTRKAAFLIDEGGLKRLDFHLTGEITRTVASGR